MKIGVIGAGYVGLVTAACLAENSNDVFIYDIDKEKLRVISDGRVPFYEKGLEEIVRKTVSRSLHPVFGLTETLLQSEVIFIAVGTPEGEDGNVDINYVLEAAGNIGRVIAETKDFKVIAVKSTVPPGTTRSLMPIISKYRERNTFAVASNPEFLKEGDAVNDFNKPDRVIIGTEDPRAEKLLKELYAPFARKDENRILSMGIEDAELTKYSSNAHLAIRISFMNQLALAAERLGANIDNVREGIGADKRIGDSFLFPGPGYGGSCFPKDVRGMLRFGGSDLTILKATDEFNKRQRVLFANRVIDYFNGGINGRRIAIWGAAFKPGTDDARESSAIYTIKKLLEHGAQVQIYDPEPRALENLRKELTSRFERELDGDVSYYRELYGVLDDASALIILNDCKQFRQPDFERVKSRLKEPVIVDARNLYPLEKMERFGFDYISLGRRRILARTQTR